MDSINDAALLEILGQLPARCPDFAGAVVATRDGLVLAAIGDYQGDTPAACAASLSVHVQDDLAPLGAAGGDGAPMELLVLGEGRLWYLSRLAAGHLLLIASTQTTQVGAVRLAGQSTASSLNHWLNPS